MTDMKSDGMRTRALSERNRGDSGAIYTVKEVFLTLQGEGAHTGRPAVFVRFSGCNLWTGREEDRAKAICQFCDTDFRGTDGPNGGRYTAAELVEVVMRVGGPCKFIVCTGGEPLLQLDETLLGAFHRAGYFVAVESNGTVPVPDGIDWLCISPKAGAKTIVTTGDELKLVYPQDGLHPDRIDTAGFDNLYLQPMDGPDLNANTASAVNYCLRNPAWRLSTQTHKTLGID